MSTEAELHRRQPWMKVQTFGQFLIEGRTLEESSQYIRIDIAKWPRRGYVSPLFKILLNQRGRYGTRDKLLGIFWPDENIKKAGRYLDEVAYQLRKVLSLPGAESLLHTVPGGTSGSGYQLDDQQLLWTDADAFLEYVRLATRAQNPEEAISLWERAYELVKGEFMPDDLDSSWTQGRRAILNEKFGQCIHTLADLYIRKKQPEKALDILWDYVTEHSMDEDAALRLMLILEHQERYRAAWDRYSALKEFFHKENKALSPRMHRLARRIKSHLENNTLEEGQESASFAPPFVGLDIGEMTTIPSPTGTIVICAEPSGNFSRCSERLATLITRIHKWYGHQSCDQLQQFLEQEFFIMTSVGSGWAEDDVRLTRREVLPVIAALPAALVAATRQNVRPSLAPEEFLPQCAASLSASWFLLTGDGLATAAAQLPKYLPYLLALASHPSKYQKTASYLSGQGCLLMGLVSLHQLPAPKNLQTRVAYCQQAVNYARVSGNMTLLIAGLTHLANASFDVGEPGKMLQYHAEAAQYAQEHQNNLLSSKTLSGLAHAQAQHALVQDTLRSIGMAREIFPTKDEESPAFLKTDYGQFSLILFEGIVRRDLASRDPMGGHHWEAARALAQIEKVQFVPERFRVEITLERAGAAVLTNNQELFKHFLLEGAEGARRLNSQKRKEEAFQVYRMARQVWESDSPLLRDLADYLLMLE